MRVMKKIIKIKEIPLEKVVLRLEFSEDFDLSIGDAGVLSQKLKEFYPREPNLVLLPILKAGQQIDLPPMGPLRFFDENQNAIEFGKNYVIFIFEEYGDWESLITKILKILSILVEILNLKQILALNLTYNDIFSIPKQNFRFKDYFTLNLKIPNNWDVLPHDLIIGIVPYQRKNIKIVLRLRNAKGKTSDDYGFSFEAIYIHRNVLFDIKKADLNKILTNAHDYLEQYFIELITDDFKESLGLEIKNE